MTSGVWRLLSAWLLALGVAGAAPQAYAQKKSPITVSASPILGAGTPVSDGWLSVSVNIDNPTDAGVEGQVEVLSQLHWLGSGPEAVTRAPFAVAGNGSVRLLLPTHSFEQAVPDVTVRVVGPEGESLQSVQLPAPSAPGPFLFNLSTGKQGIAAAIRGRGVPVHYELPGRGYYGAPRLAASNASVKRGDPVLPVRAAGYAPATVVLGASETIARLTGPRLEALTSWVLAGGALAVVVTRPEDLRHATIEALIGGHARTSSPPVSLRGRAPFVVVPEDETSTGPEKMEIERYAPEDATFGDLTSYEGGNLTQTAWGASATYGLGEVHLLGFDPVERHVDDPWVQAKMVDLVRHAWERKAHVVLPHAQTSLDRDSVTGIRRLLDPNEGARWAIVVAAILLLFYAVLAGPVTFYRAARANRPLRALWHLPLWSFGTMALIVVLGLVAKGVRGRARHISLVEAGAGMSRASMTRFRGFYAPWTSDLTVRAASAGHVLDVAGPLEGIPRLIGVERSGIRLDALRARPWQTAVVREDGFTGLGGGVSIVERGSDAVVTNRTARDLVAIVVKLPGQAARYFPRVKDGEAVEVSKGEALDPSIGAASPHAPIAAHGLDVHEFGETIDAVAPRLSEAWASVDAYAYGSVDWWPEDVPVLLAQVDGGEGIRSDSGLALDRDQVLVRVVGWGGLP